MSGFKYVSDNIKFPITNEKDESVKTYSIRAGSEEILKSFIGEGEAALVELENLDKRERDLEVVKSALRKFVDLVLGDGEFDFLYESFDKNFFAMVELTKCLYETMADVWSKRVKGFSQ